jgi:hypothetical protein
MRLNWQSQAILLCLSAPLLFWGARLSLDKISLAQHALVFATILSGAMLALIFYYQAQKRQLRYIGAQIGIILFFTLWLYPFAYFYALTQICRCAPWQEMGIIIPPSLLVVQQWLQP